MLHGGLYHRCGLMEVKLLPPAEFLLLPSYGIPFYFIIIKKNLVKYIKNSLTNTRSFFFFKEWGKKKKEKKKTSAQSCVQCKRNKTLWNTSKGEKVAFRGFSLK